MLKPKFLIPSFALLFFIQTSFAQETVIQKTDTTGLITLDEIIVTATRSDKMLTDIGRSISLIKNEEISNSIYSNPAELLSEREGIYIVGTGQNPSMLQSLSLRGSNNSHSAIMIDGNRIYDPTTVDNSIDLSELSLLDIDKIEIVRGSHSTMFGSSAIGGVVNFITRTGREPGLHFNGALTSGTFGKRSWEFSESAYLNYTNANGFYINGELFHTKVQGLDATVDTITNPTVYDKRDRDNFNKFDLSGKIGFIDKNWDIFGSYKYANQKADLDAKSYKDDDNYTLDFNRKLLSYKASYKFNDNVKFSFNGGWTEINRTAVNDSSVIDVIGNYDNEYLRDNYKGNISNNEVQANLNYNGIEIIFGSGLTKETMTAQSYFINTVWEYKLESNLDSLDLQTTTFNSFLHFDFDGSLITENLSDLGLVLGGRFNHHSVFKDYFTYEIIPKYKIGENSLLYFSYSTGFNSPSLYQLYSPTAYYYSNITRGNSNLIPETSQSYEVGLKQQIGNNTLFTISWFNTSIDNTINYVYLWDKNIGIDTLGNDWLRDDYRGDTYLNIGKQITNGVEFSINSQVGNNLSVYGNFSMVNGKLSYNPSLIDITHTQGNHVQLFNSGTFLNKEVERIGLVRRPSTANIGMLYKVFGNLILKTDVRYVGPRNDIYYNSGLGPYGALETKSIEDYTLIDFSVKIDLNEHFSSIAKVENILNTNYQEIYGYTTRGRGVYLKISYRN